VSAIKVNEWLVVSVWWLVAVSTKKKFQFNKVN